MVVRKNLFEQRYSEIIAHNQNSNSSYTMGLNQFSDNVNYSINLFIFYLTLVAQLFFYRFRALLNGYN